MTLQECISMMKLQPDVLSHSALHSSVVARTPARPSGDSASLRK